MDYIQSNTSVWDSPSISRRSDQQVWSHKPQQFYKKTALLPQVYFQQKAPIMSGCNRQQIWNLLLIKMSGCLSVCV